MPFCSNCGAEVVEGAKFCPECGQRLKMGEATSVTGDTSPAKLTVIKGPAVSEEVVFYSDERAKCGVRVTDTRLVVTKPVVGEGQRTTTWSMANIASVSVITIPARRLLGILLAVLGLAVSVVGIRLGYAESMAVGIPLLIVGILLAALAKPTYTMRISSASGEEEPFPPTKDREWVQGIVDAMNEAFIKRG